VADNGSALRPSRRGRTERLVEHVRSLGVEPITSKPYHSTTQGKNERFGQTLFRYLDQQPLAISITELHDHEGAIWASMASRKWCGVRDASKPVRTHTLQYILNITPINNLIKTTPRQNAMTSMISTRSTASISPPE